MDIQRRYVLFVTLSFLIFLTWMYFAPAPPQPEKASAPSTPAAIAKTTVSSPNAVVSGAPAVSKKSLPAYSALNVSDKEITIETDDYIATFTNRGAVLTGYRLKKYKNRGNQEPIQLVSPDPKSVIHVDEDLEPAGVISTADPITVNSHALLDSYRSSKGAYGESNRSGPLAPVLKSGLSPEPLPTQAKNLEIHGNFLDFLKIWWSSVWNPPSETRSLGALIVKAGQAQTLTGADYQVDTLIVENNAKLIANGKVRIWFSGAVSIQGWVGTTSGKPGDLRLFGYGDNANLKVSLENGSLMGQIYAPGASINLDNFTLWGGLVGSGITIDPPLRPKPFSVQYDPLPGLNERMFQVVGSSQKLSSSNNKAELTFRYVDPSGISLEKIFELSHDGYLMGLKINVAQRGKNQVSAANLIVQLADSLGKEEITGTNSRGASAYRVTTREAGQVEAEAVKRSQESKEYPAPVAWTALANQYFMAAFIPDNSMGSASAKVIREFNSYKTPTDENPNPGVDPNVFTPQPELVYQVQALSPGEEVTRGLKAFIGPQEYKLLKSMNIGLEGVVDLGFFGFIADFMLSLLQWFYTFGHSWGLAILLLSIAVKLTLWFPTHNSYKHMSQLSQKTREIQPKLEAIKRKYADDKQKQQQETMKIYNEAGINPFGGCLPMFLQIPVFYALYATLSHSIELRGAHFLWASDLTLMDPYHVLPLLMGGTMILQQKVSGQMATQAAGQQKFMMWFFPVFLTFISFQWPAGLLLYWVVTNLLSMLQQKVVNAEIQKAKKKEEVKQS